jgi:hypothetical protein
LSTLKSKSGVELVGQAEAFMIAVPAHGIAVIVHNAVPEELRDGVITLLAGQFIEPGGANDLRTPATAT